MIDVETPEHMPSPDKKRVPVVINLQTPDLAGTSTHNIATTDVAIPHTDTATMPTDDPEWHPPCQCGCSNAPMESQILQNLVISG